MFALGDQNRRSAKGRLVLANVLFTVHLTMVCITARDRILSSFNDCVDANVRAIRYHTCACAKVFRVTGATRVTRFLHASFCPRVVVLPGDVLRADANPVVVFGGRDLAKVRQVDRELPSYQGTLSVPRMANEGLKDVHVTKAVDVSIGMWLFQAKSKDPAVTRSDGDLNDVRVLGRPLRVLIYGKDLGHRSEDATFSFSYHGRSGSVQYAQAVGDEEDNVLRSFSEFSIVKVSAHYATLCTVGWCGEEVALASE